MRTFATLFTCILSIAGTAGCGQTHNYSSGNARHRVKASGNYVRKELRMDAFDGLRINSSFDVTFTQKPGRPKVTVYTSDNLLEWLDIYVKGNTLHLGFKNNVRITYNVLKVNVEAESLDDISIAGSGSFKLDNGLETGRLKLSIAGSGNIDADKLDCTTLHASVAGSGNINAKQINCDSFDLSIAGSGGIGLEGLKAVAESKAAISGSGKIHLAGEAAEAAYSISGSGSIRASELQASRISATITGSGNIQCHATDYLKVRSSGSGSVGYKGNPELDIPQKLHKL